MSVLGHAGVVRGGVRLKAALVLATISALIILAPTSSAKPPSAEIKRYDACLQQHGGAPACSSGADTSLPGGSTVQLILTITNQRTSNQSLGSVNLDVPTGAGIAIDATKSVTPSQGNTVTPQSSGRIELRDLNLRPNTSMTVGFWVTTPCTGSDLEWRVAAKQSNDFRGTGNDFSLINRSGLRTDIEPCYELRFVDQPAKSVVGAPITDGDYSSGGPVTVGLYGSGQLLNSCPTAIGGVSISKSPAEGWLNGTLTRPLAGSPCVASFDDLSITGVSSLPKTYTLSASGVGSVVPTSEPFDIINGTNCVGQDPCNIAGSGGSSGRATGGNFTFVAFESLELGYIPDGCTGLDPLGDPLFIVEQRSALSGELHVTYGISKTQLQKKYGNNSGQQFIPICAGAKRIELVGGRTRAVDCDDLYGSTDQTGTGWWGKEIYDGGPNVGKFTGGISRAECDPDSGFFFGILGSFQEYTGANSIDPDTNPTVTGWSSDNRYRYFTSRWPSASGSGTFAVVPWDGWKFG